MLKIDTGLFNKINKSDNRLRYKRNRSDQKDQVPIRPNLTECKPQQNSWVYFQGLQ